jgi:hypothetical protein
MSSTPATERDVRKVSWFGRSAPSRTIAVEPLRRQQLQAVRRERADRRRAADRSAQIQALDLGGLPRADHGRERNGEAGLEPIGTDLARIDVPDNSVGDQHPRERRPAAGEITALEIELTRREAVRRIADCDHGRSRKRVQRLEEPTVIGGIRRLVEKEVDAERTHVAPPELAHKVREKATIDRRAERKSRHGVLVDREHDDVAALGPRRREVCRPEIVEQQ